MDAFLLGHGVDKEAIKSNMLVCTFIGIIFLMVNRTTNLDFIFILLQVNHHNYFTSPRILCNLGRGHTNDDILFIIVLL